MTAPDLQPVAGKTSAAGRDGECVRRGTVSILAGIDMRSAHISSEAVACPGIRPGRCACVHAPKHGSWPKPIECAFSKMARGFLRHIRVKSIDEVEERVVRGIAEFNALTATLRFNKFDLGVSVA